MSDMTKFFPGGYICQFYLDKSQALPHIVWETILNMAEQNPTDKYAKYRDTTRLWLPPPYSISSEAHINKPITRFLRADDMFDRLLPALEAARVNADKPKIRLLSSESTIHYKPYPIAVDFINVTDTYDDDARFSTAQAHAKSILESQADTSAAVVYCKQEDSHYRYNTLIVTRDTTYIVDQDFDVDPEREAQKVKVSVQQAVSLLRDVTDDETALLGSLLITDAMLKSVKPLSECNTINRTIAQLKQDYPHAWEVYQDDQKAIDNEGGLPVKIDEDNPEASLTAIAIGAK